MVSVNFLAAERYSLMPPDFSCFSLRSSHWQRSVLCLIMQTNLIPGVRFATCAESPWALAALQLPVPRPLLGAAASSALTNGE